MLPIALTLLATQAAPLESSGLDLCLELPGGLVQADWAAAVEMAGMRLGEGGCDATAEFKAGRGGWKLTVRTPDGVVHRPDDRFPAPRTVDDREELVWLIYSLLHPVHGLAFPDREGGEHAPGVGEPAPEAAGGADEAPPPDVLVERESPEPPTLDLRVVRPEAVEPVALTRPVEPPAPPRPIPESPALAPVPSPPPPQAPPVVAVATVEAPALAPEPPEPATLAPEPPEPVAPATPGSPETVQVHRPARVPSLFFEGAAGLVSRSGVTDAVQVRTTVGLTSLGGRLRYGLGAQLPASYTVAVLGPTRALGMVDAAAGAWWQPGGSVGVVAGGLLGLSWRTFTEEEAKVDTRTIPTASVEAGLSLSFGSRWSLQVEPRLYVQLDLAGTDMIVDGALAGSLVPWSRGVTLGLLLVTP